MKKYFFLAALLCVGATFNSCGKDDENEVTPEPEQPQVKTAVLDFEGEGWSKYIPNGQAYGCNLIYGDEALTYGWKDTNTGLSSELTKAWGGSYGFAEGGIVVSNYIDADIQNHATADYQLSIPTSNGSKNFAVVYCEATLKFPEGEKHVIRSIDISPTTYELGVVKYGNQYAKSLAEEGYLELVIIADNEEYLTINMARSGRILEGWKTYQMNTFSEPVNSLTFTMRGSDTSGDYLNTPAYFAFDNVVVEL